MRRTPIWTSRSTSQEASGSACEFLGHAVFCGVEASALVEGVAEALERCAARACSARASRASGVAMRSSVGFAMVDAGLLAAGI